MKEADIESKKVETAFRAMQVKFGKKHHGKTTTKNVVVAAPKKAKAVPKNKKK